MMKINVIDLFAGCGGLTDGFLQTNKYKTLAAVDWEYPTVNTLRNRMSTKWGYSDSEERVIHFDIQRTEELINGYYDDQFGEHEGLNSFIQDQKVDMIVGGPPCQAYSIAGRVRDENGMHDDYRNFLFESYIEVVKHFQPEAFVFENVEGILSAKPGGINIVDRVQKAFNDIGYEITDNLRNQALFDTSFYGVPQKRKRVIIFGIKQQEDDKAIVRKFYSEMKQRASKTPLNSSVAFANLPKIYPDQNNPKHSHTVEKESSEILNHEPRKHSDRDIDIFKLLTKDIKTGEEKYTSSKALIQLYKERTGKKSKFHKYHVIRENKPSNTIPAHLYKDGLRHIHPDPQQARSITVREAARLQSFDDDFEFLGSRGDQYKMIGNAVPPTFAKVIGEVVYSILINIKNAHNERVLEELI